ncbi:amino acid adenylation domain-containing protein [Pseudenhygromyxa sp. WMMC2535]|uniref:amino acid adenylation domain-containing protein n=1 Tax=Pseudenhygromyxa sp. WMMC2535 TaxID=2712867 RepID=UPI001551A173|nr:amino acid adenylation domain-containing protein [Pseudenhygromyxa sp. WMMC2535]NVB37536.1 amino acid adenylation domain-containing protein [Pseudenhygromyxa sp. WMMC2535]
MNLGRLVTAAAKAAPEALAVIGPKRQLRYAELDDAAARVAAGLSAAGVREGDRVALWMDKSCDAVVAMQAALRLGAVYVPIDPQGPGRRARKVILDCGARCLITDAGRPSPLADEDPPVLLVGAEAPGALAWAELLASAPLERAGQGEQGEHDPEALAYILYTSGSTGAPKGVGISHRAAWAFVAWAVDTLQAGPTDRFSSHAPFHFDLSVLDLYAAFAVGARVCLIPPSLGPGEHVGFIREQGISVWYSVPSVLMMMMEHGGLLELEARLHPRALLFAGEPFPIKHLRELRAHFADARLLNLYGPTETNVCTAYEVTTIEPERSKPVPIGAPCCGDEAWAETAAGERAGPGETGELMVRGPTTMTGYWGQAPLGDRAYATGDIVRVLDDGSFDFVGRRDHMVKVRGMRIEIGEVEAALLEYPGLNALAVLVAGAGLDARLVAFVRLAEGAKPPSLLALKRHCAQRVPRYMVVDRVIYVDALPLTSTGKIDRRALAERLDKEVSHASQ